MSAEIVSFRDLEVWRRAVDLVLETYTVAKKLPPSEKYELSSQMRRAAVSIPSNIAEGHARRGRTYLHCVRIAVGSLAELDTHLEVALRLELLTGADTIVLAKEIVRVRQMLHGLLRSLLLRFAAKAAGSATALLMFCGAAFSLLQF